MPAPLSHEEERQAYAEFASRLGEEEFRTRLARFYETWNGFNERFFADRLLQPHFTIGRTASRSLGHCSATTDYGGKVQIILNAGLVFGTNQDWVLQPWSPGNDTGSGQGTWRFLADLLLRFTVRQYVLEVDQSEERGYQHFGPRFVAQANRVGSLLGLRPVVARRRGTDTTSPLAHGWPHSARKAAYYRGDLTEQALELARGTAFCGFGRRMAQAPTEGLAELFLHLLQSGKASRAQAVAEGYLKSIREECGNRRHRRNPLPACEDVSSAAPGDLAWDPAWVAWNGGTVLRLVRTIVAGSSWDGQLLAEALEQAGCTERQILDHLRSGAEHRRRCWVVHGLMTLAASGSDWLES